MIYVLKESREYDDTYYIKKFNTYDEALDFIKNDNEYLNCYRFIEGKDLTLTFKLEDKEVENE